MIPELRAQQLIEEIGLSSLPIDPFALAKTLEIQVNELDLGDACDGFLLVQNQDSVIGINNKIKNRQRRNFTCAHELGHFCMDVVPGQATKIECQPGDIGGYSRSVTVVEIRANKFASELLLPKTFVMTEIQNRLLNWDSIDAIANLGNVSRTVSARRFIELTDEACAFIVSRENKICWYATSSSFSLRLDMDSRLLTADSAAGRIFKGENPDGKFVDVPAWAWVAGGKVKGELQEYSLPLNSYGQVLTILWDDIGICDESADQEDGESEREEFDSRYGWETPTFHKSKRRS